MTVATLSKELTQEELIAWAAFFEIKQEEEEKSMQQARTSSKAQTMGSR